MIKRYDCCFCSFVVHPLFNNIKGSDAEKEAAVKRICQAATPTHEKIKNIMTKAINSRLDTMLKDQGVKESERGDKSMELIHNDWEKYEKSIDCSLMESLGKEFVKVLDYLRETKKIEEVSA